MVTSTIVSFRPRTLDQAEHGRQLQPVALVTSTGVSFRPRTSPPFPAALVTNMIVSFTPRTLDRAEPGVSFSRWPW